MTTIEHEELEHLSNKLIKGNDTLVLFNILKESNHLESLLEELTGEVYIKRVDEYSSTHPSPIDLESWFNEGLIINKE